MIVDPDFFDHWRTRIVYDLLGEDDLTPIYIMRIWAHCQSRKATRFDGMSSLGLKALCRFKGDPAVLEAALIEAGFVVRDGTAIDVPKWAEHNSKLIANWKNGATGGRPRQSEEEPTDNPTETQPEPTGTQPEPIGLDKNGLDKTEPKSKAKASATPKRKPAKTSLPGDFSISPAVRQWAEQKGYPHLQGHFDSFVRKCRAKGYTYADWGQAFQNAVADDWANLNVPQARASPSSKPTKFDPVAHVNRNRNEPNEQPFTLDAATGKPV